MLGKKECLATDPTEVAGRPIWGENGNTNWGVAQVPGWQVLANVSVNSSVVVSENSRVSQQA